MSDAAALGRCVLDLSDPACWPDADAREAEQVVRHLSERALFASLASIAACAEGIDSGGVAVHLSGQLTARFLATADALTDEAKAAARPWAIFCVPHALVAPHVAPLARVALRSVGLRPASEALPAIAQLAAELGFRGPGGAARCGLQLLSALAEALSRSGQREVPADSAVAFVRLARSVLASFSREARLRLAPLLLGTATHDAAARPGPSPAAEAGDTSLAEPFAALCALAPKLVDAAPTPPAASPAPHQDSEPRLTVPLASPQLIAQLGDACLGLKERPVDADCSVVTGGLSTSGASSVHAASELSLYLCMLLSLCSGNRLWRQQIEAGWAAALLPKMLWRGALRTMTVEFGAAGLLSPRARLGAWQQSQLSVAWGLPSELPVWLLPATVLSAIYSRYAATQSDARLYSEQVRCVHRGVRAMGETQVTPATCPAAIKPCRSVGWRSGQAASSNASGRLQAPIPLSDLGPSSDSQTPGLVPFLRDALFQTFTSKALKAPRATPSGVFGQRPAEPIAPDADGARCVALISSAFKVLAGELLSQLHARAARVKTVADAWFYAPELQQTWLLRGAPSPRVCVNSRFRVRARPSASLGVACSRSHVWQVGQRGPADVARALQRGTDVLAAHDDDGDDAMEDSDDLSAASARVPTGLAYIELLRYAPCLVAFHQRAQVFQRLVQVDKQVFIDIPVLISRVCSTAVRLSAVPGLVPDSGHCVAARQLGV